ncbi:hypothetical protein A9762_04945 [Pandoraea sp. ISTKB]|nr:hypothetical protein A9762_04945 [Pandoraea sp. ISTKB]
MSTSPTTILQEDAMWDQQCAGASGWGPDWGIRQRPEVGIELAGMREDAAYQRAECADFGTRLTHASNAALNAARHARMDGVPVATHRVDPALARAFAKAWAGLWATTGPCQHFYRKEFELAHARDGRLAQTGQRVAAMLAPTHGVASPPSPEAAAERVGAEIASWLETIAATGHRGWHFRAARDAMSLVGNLSLLAIIAACFHQRQAQQAQDTTGEPSLHGASDMAAANTPFGIPWADWTLLAFEGLKGVLTQSLGSPTLIRHHAVDEVLKRMEAGCRLLEACVVLPSPAATTSWRNTLGKLTHSRDVATLFTFANTAIPPARLGLWMPSWFTGTSPISAISDGYRGILRVAGLMLDSCRAVTSLLGTWARNEAFTHDAGRLTQRWETLHARLAHVSPDDVATMLDRVARVTQLARHCDTPLLTKLASHTTLRECLLTSRHPLSASQIKAACSEFDVPCHASCVDGLNYLSLNPAESPWGQRWTGDAWESGSATPVRASYRLLLLYQHWSAALLERVVGASGCAGGQEATSNKPSDTKPSGEPPTQRDATYVDIQSTWL